MIKCLLLTSTILTISCSLSIDSSNDCNSGQCDETVSFEHCNEELFGTNAPGFLEPLWGQNAIGAGLLRDALLTENEKQVAVHVSVTGEHPHLNRSQNFIPMELGRFTRLIHTLMTFMPLPRQHYSLGFGQVLYFHLIGTLHFPLKRSLTMIKGL